MAKLQGFARVEQAFLTAAWDSTQWDNALQIASDEMGSTGAGILPVVGNVPKLAVAPKTYEVFDAYMKGGWFPLDERRRCVPELMRFGAVIDQDIFQPEEIKRSPFYQDLLARCGFGWFLAMKITTPDDVWTIAFQRTVLEGPFDRSNKMRMAQWGKHLSVPATLAASIDQAKLKAVSDLLDVIGRPCALLNRQGEIVRFNQPGEALLGAHVSINKRKMRFADREATGRFSEAVGMLTMAGNGPMSCGPIIVARDGAPPLALYLFKTDFADISPFSPACILVLINDLAARPIARADELRAAFGLTGMEARLGEILSDGTGLPDAADLLRITDETARTHLKSIFHKTGVKRQTALMALLARLKR